MSIVADSVHPALESRLRFVYDSLNELGIYPHSEENDGGENQSTKEFRILVGHKVEQVHRGRKEELLEALKTDKQEVDPHILDLEKQVTEVDKNIAEFGDVEGGAYVKQFRLLRRNYQSKIDKYYEERVYEVIGSSPAQFAVRYHDWRMSEAEE